VSTDEESNNGTNRGNAERSSSDSGIGGVGRGNKRLASRKKTPEKTSSPEVELAAVARLLVSEVVDTSLAEVKGEETHLAMLGGPRELRRKSP